MHPVLCNTLSHGHGHQEKGLLLVPALEGNFKAQNKIFKYWTPRLNFLLVGDNSNIRSKFDEKWNNHAVCREQIGRHLDTRACCLTWHRRCDNW